MAALTFKGAFENPKKLKYKFGELTLSVRSDVAHEKYDDVPRSIGGLSANADTLYAYIFVPVERFAELAAVAATNRVQVAYIHGTRIRYRSGAVTGFSLSTGIEEEETSD